MGKPGRRGVSSCAPLFLLGACWLGPGRTVDIPRLPCDELPGADLVRSVVQENRDELDRWRAIDPGHVMYSVHVDRCPGKAELVVLYSGPAGKTLREKLSTGRFHGIPVVLLNV